MRLRLPQFAVYWAPVGLDGYGKVKYAAPAQVACRWEDGVTETIDKTGATVLSSATVYASVPMAVGGALLKGKLQDLGSGFPANPRNDKRVIEIINAGNVPSLKATQSLTTVKLK